MSGPDWKTAQYVRLNHSQVTPESDKDWNAWYNSIHVPDLVGVPGYIGCRRFRRMDQANQYLSLWDLSDPNAIYTDEFKRVAGNGPLTASVTSFGPSRSGISYQETFRITADEAPGSAKAQAASADGNDWNTTRYVRVIHSQVTSDVEQEWNEWYNRVHVPALLQVPGYAGCRRFRRLDETNKYLSIFDLEDPEAVNSEEFRRAAGNGPYADKVTSFGPARHGITYEEITRLEKSQLRK